MECLLSIFTRSCLVNPIQLIIQIKIYRLKKPPTFKIGEIHVNNFHEMDCSISAQPNIISSQRQVQCIVSQWLRKQGILFCLGRRSLVPSSKESLFLFLSSRSIKYTPRTSGILCLGVWEIVLDNLSFKFQSAYTLPDDGAIDQELA